MDGNEPDSKENHIVLTFEKDQGLTIHDKMLLEIQKQTEIKQKDYDEAAKMVKELQETPLKENKELIKNVEE
jgi:uncharacterized protein HemY